MFLWVLLVMGLVRGRRGHVVYEDDDRGMCRGTLRCAGRLVAQVPQVPG